MLIKAVHAMTRIIHKNWNSHLDNCLRDFWWLFGRWRFLWVILFNQRGHVWAYRGHTIRQYICVCDISLCETI